MKNNAKIQLSADEAKLITNTEWILTKHSIIEKVFQMFGDINEMMKDEINNLEKIIPEIKGSNGKIFKGENYRLLPYVILDYPSSFSKNNIFAVRTMFWWGNFFSITLHLSGEHKMKFVANNPEFLLFLKKNSFFICANTEEWQHHFEESNYLNATKVTDSLFEKIIQQPFFKVAKKLPVNQWNDVCSFIMNSFKEILELLQINFQDDKKDPLPVFPIIGSGL